MYHTILFDLDGTLTDPGVGITNSVAYALKKHGIEVADRTALYPFIGPPLLDSFQRFYGFSAEQSEQAVADYRVYFREKGLFENEVYEGVEELLRRLKASGKRLIIATSKPEEFAVRILKHFGLASYFEHIVGATMDSSRSKKGDVIAHALKVCGITERTDVVMIGDREHDVLGAIENSLDSIGVLYGYGSREELEAAGATYVAETVEEILRFV